MSSFAQALLVRAGACTFHTDARTGKLTELPYVSTGTGGLIAPDSATPPILGPFPEPAGSILDLWASPRTESWIG